MSHTDKSVETQRSEGGFRYAVATFFLLGAVSTLTQMVSIASLGLPVNPEWSTGGLVAVIAAVWFWLRCRSWAAWRKWVWIPVVVTIVIAFVTVNLMVASARQAAENEAAAQHAATCSRAKAELASMNASQDALLDRTWKYQGSWGVRTDDWRPQPGSGTEPAWRQKLRDMGAELGPSQDDVWAFYVAAGGPQLETDLAQHQVAYSTQCGSD